MSEVQFERILTTENHDHHLELMLFGVHLLYNSMESAERAVVDLDSLTDDKRNFLNLIKLSLFNVTEQTVDIGITHRRSDGRYHRGILTR